ncbi:outer membrane protein assembly factor BamB family protein [Methanothrix harundinacea]|uniref:outer membrane protein assembly factor BamB family protein n=1 Tax=Methanothrix harundinacea TaxID=301375 RepID=UPI0009DA85F5|nr:PQQ-binding-like beta-propeller repeat protein [Methanothrix harundinacea]
MIALLKFGRSIGTAAGIFALILAVAALAASPAGGGPIPPEVSDGARDWPLPNGDYENTRAAAGSAINSENVGELGVVWSFPIPGIGAYGAAASNPIIVGDVVYFQDLRCNVFALDLETGDPIWSRFYNVTEVVGPNGPAVGWGKVFVAKDLYNVTALDAGTGEEVWTTRLSEVATTGIDIQPSVYAGLVYVSTVPGTGDVFYAPGGIGVISALDAETGDIVWEFSTVDSPDLWGNPGVNSGGGAWYPPAVDVETGITFWGTGNPAPFPGTEEWPSGTSRPGPNLYTDSLVALDHATGDMIWYHQVLPHDLFDHDFQISPILAERDSGGRSQKVVYGAGKMGKVYAFDRTSGELLWSAVVGRYDEAAQLDVLPEGTTRIYPGVLGGVETPMAYSDGVLYVPVVNLFTDWTPTSLDTSTIDFNNGTGELVAIDASTGKILWIRSFETMALGGATVINDLVFAAEYDGTIHAFRAETGEEVWEMRAPAGINGWPAVAGETIVWPAGVGADPKLVAFRLGGAAEAAAGEDETDEGDEDEAVPGPTAQVAGSSAEEAPSTVLTVHEIPLEAAGWAADGVISEGEYSKNLTLSGGRYVVSWRNDGETLYMGLAGQAEGFVAIGFEPTQAMKDADMVMGWVSGGEATVLDLYSTGVYGPHPPDEELGGTDDILSFGGREADGWTVIEFERRMDTGDRFDQAFRPGETVNIIWSISSTDSLEIRHNVGRGGGRISLEG